MTPSKATRQFNSVIFRCTVAFTFFSLTTPHTAFAQYYTNQNKIWAFGDSSGLDFNSGSPVLRTSHINSAEAAAAVSDSLGRLLFYTDGTRVYDSAGTIMPSGAAIVSYLTPSSSQGALIVPNLSNRKQYYVFSEGEQEDTTVFRARLSYTKVDMTLRSGLGDVVAGTRGVLLNTKMGEGMCAVAGHNCVWVVTHKRDSDLFLAYQVSAYSVNPTPVVSTGGLFGAFNCYMVNTIRCSTNPSGHSTSLKICQSIATGSCGAGKTAIYDFDPATGIVSGGIIVDSAYISYSGEFSPDGSKLYVSQTAAGTSAFSRLVQYDLTMPTSAAIMASAYRLDTVPYTWFAGIKLAPDGKIYVSSYTGNLNCVNNPNVAGVGCGYVSNAVTLAGHATLELSALYVEPDFASLSTSHLRGSIAHLYPNPAHDWLNITLSEPIDQITITNMLGQTVLESTPTSNVWRMDVSSLPNGLYNARVNDQVQHFLKE